MNKIEQATGAELRFVEPKAFKESFELRSGPGLMGKLIFGSSMGTLATAETASGIWTFKRVGFLDPRVTIRVAGKEEDIAVFAPRFWGGGNLELRDGRGFKWRSINFWSTRWGFTDRREMPVVDFIPGNAEPGLSGIFKHEAEVKVDGSAWSLPELPLLIMAGWYLMVLQYRDSAAVAATT
ncbi:MAG TPA: hypothetical protein PK747_04690 [Acidobacteriota bacterium]|jgi:hypothetical protein|nr:hypothetical protein [Acidobacteriota bacterium]HNT17400.1 hypothetical protein [Acidobacteriota bacterium]HPA27565.1 hypothetical protein [Acidobacteriota bacterium]HQO18801.1 hypothetical protein [Acidobacteriota bacterium]HQQ46690.1 hypothetical protein [Acidobacteriota bacterium]